MLKAKKNSYIYIIIAGLMLITSFTGAIINAYGMDNTLDKINMDQSSLTIKTAFKDGVGTYLTDTNGMALYLFTNDVIGKSTAEGKVLAAWPIFYTDVLNVSSDLNISDFSQIIRDDGQMVTTYKGWPLYYFIKDKNKGDTTGEGVGKVWYLIKQPFYTVTIGTKEGLGNYLTDTAGRTLYYFTKDTPGVSNAKGDVIVKWPPFAQEELTLPGLLNPDDFGTIIREDNYTQLTFKGYPLYYYASDTKHGDTLGQDVNSIWYVVDPFGFNP